MSAYLSLKQELIDTLGNKTTISTENCSTFNSILSKSGKFWVGSFRLLLDQVYRLNADCLAQTGNFLTYIVYNLFAITERTATCTEDNLSAKQVNLCNISATRGAS